MRKIKLILLILVFPVVKKTLNIITYMKQLIMGICKQLRILFERIPFIKKGVNVNARDKDGGAPLASYPSEALFVGKWDTAKILIDNRNKGFTPLHAAAREGYTYIAKFLISKGADVNARTKDSGTPLEFAVMYGYKETAKFLISKGADVNVRDSFFDRTPLHFAASVDYMDIAKLLIANGADVNAKDKYGETPLDVFRKREKY